MKKYRDIAPFGVRMPPELKEKLRKAAGQKLGGSINSEIVDRLEASFQARHGLKDFSDGELVQELINRWGREAVYIRLGKEESK